jgi:hypothetical protein
LSCPEEELDDTALGVLIGVIVLIILGMVITFTAIFTHESHLRDIRYDKTEIIVCLQKGHEPLECREMVYGRGH